MKKLVTYVALVSSLLGGKAMATAHSWQEIPKGSAPSTQIQAFHPTNYLVYTFDEELLKTQMFSLSTDPNEAMIVELPMPDGNFRNFKAWQDPMLPDELAAKYPDIKTFTIVAADDARVTGKLDFTLFGFHAMVLDADNTYMIDPYDHFHDGYYMVHFKRDETRQAGELMHCQVKGKDETGPAGDALQLAQAPLPKLAAKTVNAYTRRTYRLALSADSFYCRAATGLTSPTVAQALSCMTTSMNRINGVYNHEFSVQMNFCTKEDTLIFGCSGHTNGNDPFATIDNNGGACLSQNQPVCDGRIGSANYDVGHVFTTGGGGISSLGVVCQNGSKAQSCTGSPSPTGDGFDIDYVAHEMGHEFGSEHTFNNNMDGSCGGNAVSTCAYEPGSGATIMDYAGICDPDDLQYHSDAYFSSSSEQQIIDQLVSTETSCAVTSATSNKLVSIPAFSASYTIPYKTPFELVGPTAADSVADTAITYDWAQWNLGDFGKELVNTHLRGPIFRSYYPSSTPLRVFPKLSMVLSGTLSNAGVEGAEGEKVPDTARFMTFKMAVRDMISGNGAFTLPDDTIHINAVATSTFQGFKVTSQGASGISYNGGSTQTITWNVVGTNAAPVSASNVDIYMSLDGGNTWFYHVGTFPNSGTASITVPNPATTSSTCRFKVKGGNNVFFNVNLSNFTVSHNSSLPNSSSVANVNTLSGSLKVFPVPATDVLHITTGISTSVFAVIYNTVGQKVWDGTINDNTDIATGTWARGVYHIQFITADGTDKTVRSVILQ